MACGSATAASAEVLKVSFGARRQCINTQCLRPCIRHEYFLEVFCMREWGWFRIHHHSSCFWAVTGFMPKNHQHVWAECRLSPFWLYSAPSCLLLTHCWGPVNMRDRTLILQCHCLCDVLCSRLCWASAQIGQVPFVAVLGATSGSTAMRCKLWAQRLQAALPYLACGVPPHTPTPTHPNHHTRNAST